MRGRPRNQIYEDELPEINTQKGSRTKVESDSDSDPHYSDYLKQTQARNRRKKNAEKPKNINEFESEESENYFSTSEDEINDIETSHERNDGENYNENLEKNFEEDFKENSEKNFEQNFKENFEDNFEANFEKKFEENQEGKLEEEFEEEFEEPFFEKNLKLNRRSQINSEKYYNDHDDYNRPPPEPPPINSQTDKIITRKNIVEYRDQLTMRKDNYAYFVTTNGTPCDNGSKTLEKRETLPKFKNLQNGIAKETKKENHYHFALPIEEETKDNLSESLNNIKSSIYSLHELSRNLKLRSISISKTSKINHIPWEGVKSIFDSIFSNSTTQIIVCNGITQYPTKEQRTHLIEEAHSSALGGHKGVTKSYSRIRQKFFWENMKVDIHKYIEGCLQCQLKKLIKVKTKNPMVITDTPTTAFEKILMDIFSPLPETKAGNLNILTIQDNFTKYSFAIPLPYH